MTTTAIVGSPARPGRTSSGTRALSWWENYCHPERGDAGTRARLRRSRSTLEALGVPAAIVLARSLGLVRNSAIAPDWRIRAGLDLSRLLSHVTGNDGTRHPMRAAGYRRFPGGRQSELRTDEQPILSVVRFRRLLQTGEGEEKLTSFVRLVDLLGGNVSVASISEDFLLWNHPEIGDRVRERWAFLYFAAGSSAPSISPNEDEGDE